MPTAEPTDMPSADPTGPTSEPTLSPIDPDCWYVVDLGATNSTYEDVICKDYSYTPAGGTKRIRDPTTGEIIQEEDGHSNATTPRECAEYVMTYCEVQTTYFTYRVSNQACHCANEVDGCVIPDDLMYKPNVNLYRIIQGPPCETDAPTALPSAEPTVSPTTLPTTYPTGSPSAEPTGMPTAEPTGMPPAEPTGMPSAEPSADPTGPTGEPTLSPIDPDCWYVVDLGADNSTYANVICEDYSYTPAGGTKRIRDPTTGEIIQEEDG